MALIPTTVPNAAKPLVHRATARRPRSANTAPAASTTPISAAGPAAAGAHATVRCSREATRKVAASTIMPRRK